MTDETRPFGPLDEVEVRLGGHTRHLIFDYDAIAKIELAATKMFGMRTTVFQLIDAPSPVNLALIIMGGVDHGGEGGLADKGVKKRPTVDRMLKWLSDDRKHFLDLWVTITRAVRGAFPELAEMETEAGETKEGEQKASLTPTSDDDEK